MIYPDLETTLINIVSFCTSILSTIVILMAFLIAIINVNTKSKYETTKTLQKKYNPLLGNITFEKLKSNQKIDFF